MHTVVPNPNSLRYFTCPPKIINYLSGNVWHRLDPHYNRWASRESLTGLATVTREGGA